MTIPELSYSMLGAEQGVGAAAAAAGGGDMQVKAEDIQGLLEFFSKNNTYKAKDTQPKGQNIMKKCLGLFSLDYNYSVLPNTGGELSTNYPSSMVILESEKDSSVIIPSKLCLSSAVTTPSNGSVMFQSNGSNGLTSSGHSTATATNGLAEADAESVMQSSSSNPAANGTTNSGANNSLTGNGVVHEQDLNSIFIETSDFPLTPEKDIKSNLGSNQSESPIRLVTSPSFTSSTNSDLGGSCAAAENGATELTKLKDLCSRARFARCRARFPIPVILYKQKHICRSATLSGGPEIYGRSSLDYLFSGGGGDGKQYCDEGEDEFFVAEPQSDWQLFDKVRSQDIRLLKAFQVQTIVDLMVEKKKVKFGVNVTSSEKVDKENRYSEFTLVSLPYPGCEFFKKYRDNGYNGEDLVFEWNQTHVDANIYVPPDPITANLTTDWSAYRKWDLIVLTQNYLKLLLAYLRESEDGLLIHCISGWDRTPLFVSLLRLSLWADGVIHKSLSAEQILYLTLAYDWLLFGHNLEDRLSKGEEILFFCFYFLKFIVNGDYSVEICKEVPKSNQNLRTRNDSDIQLDGVLLEGGSLASPEGSSWSLNSCSSSSSKSIDNNPPVYFNVESESWDDSITAVNHMRHRNGSRKKESSCTVQGLETLPLSSSSSFAHNSDETDCRSTAAAATTSNGNLDLASLIQEPTTTPCSSIPNHHHPQCSTQSRPDSSQLHNHTTSSAICVPNGNGSCAEENQCQVRTSPVAVPRSNRSSHHRHESSSSASIGSWQFITGTGSLRETISSSDPGSSHSHPSRLSLSSAIECIEASESSCTLVEELTPVEFPERHPLSSFDSSYEVPENGGNGFGNELDETLVHGDAHKHRKFVPASTEAPVAGGKAGRPTNSSSSQFSGSSNNFISRRRDRLQTVRAHFYTLYAAAIGFQFKNANDNGSSGLGSLIGNIATKVGIRSSNRHMS